MIKMRTKVWLIRGLIVIWTVMMVIALGACAGNRWAPIGAFPTVSVTNHSLDPVRVYAVAYGSDRYMGTVMAGETRCLRLPFAEMTYNLRARSLAGEVTSAAFQPDRPSGWAWVLNEGLRAHDGLSLLPTPESCR